MHQFKCLLGEQTVEPAKNIIIASSLGGVNGKVEFIS